MSKLKYCLFIITITLSASASVFAETVNLKRVEPMFWWTGMKNPNLQLLIYGENISNTRVELKYPGVSIEHVNQVENPNYLFLNLSINPAAKPGKFDIRFIKNNSEVATYTYELKERRKNAAKRKGFNTSDVVYLIMPDRFANGNPYNDTMPGMKEKANRKDPNGRHGGDIQGIIDHLDYLQDLGIAAIWNTPLMEDNEPVTSYHTYAISDYYKIDPRYGTNHDYVRLAEECHKRGIKLIMDMVTNHCGAAHWWMNDLPTSDWVHQFPEFTRSNYRMETLTDPYTSKADAKFFSDGWFDKSMPDMNQENDLLMTYFIQNNIWWIEYANLDGIRMDTYPYNNREGMAKWAKAVMEEYPRINLVGESWLHSASEVAYWQKDAINPDGYNSWLPSVMDFPLTDALNLAFHETQGWDTGIVRIYLSLAKDYLYPNPQNLLIFIDNHDTSRAMTILKNDLRKFKMLMAFLLTTRGIPQIYAGTEILMEGNKSDGDGVMRKDFPGGWPGDERNAFMEKGRTPKENEAFNYLRKMLNWRKENPVVHTGKLTHFVPQDEVYVYFRNNSEKTVMVILNNDEKNSKNLSTSRFKECIKGFTSAVDVMSGEQLEDISTILISAKSVRILELKK